MAIAQTVTTKKPLKTGVLEVWTILRYSCRVSMENFLDLVCEYDNVAAFGEKATDWPQSA
jgi:hypothetical protein